MMKKQLFSIVGFLSFAWQAFAQIGGPFTPQSGGGYAGLQIRYVGYNQVKLVDDTTRTGNLLRDVSDFSALLHAEYGLSEKFSLFAAFPIKYVSTGQTVNPQADFQDTLQYGSKLGIGNIEAGLKYKFYEKKFSMAVSLKGELRTGNYDDKTGLSTGYQAWGINPMLHIGKFWSEKFYVMLNGGGCFRTNNFSSDWRINAEGGAKLLKVVWVKAGVDVRQSFFNGTYNREPNNQTALYVDNQEWVGIYGSLGYEASIGFGINLGIQGNVAGNNIPNSIFFNGGIYYKWKYAPPTY